MIYVKEYIQPDITHSKAIRTALEALKKETGDRTLVFSGQDYYIDEAILLPSDTTIYVDGCKIQQNDRVFDNVFRGDNLEVDPENPYGAPLRVTPLRNVKIIGKNGARLVGADIPRRGWHTFFEREENMVGDFWGWRTHMISLSLCTGFEISGLTLSQTKGWAICFDSANNGYVHDLAIFSHAKNGDGIDFRSGCHHCKVENITGYTSDDTVACTALFNKNAPRPRPLSKYLYPGEPYNATQKVLENADIHDIEICSIHTGGYMHGIICLAGWGNQVYNIHIRDIKESVEADRPRESTVKLYAGNAENGYGREYKKGDIHDITIDSVEGAKSKYAVFVAAETENVTIRNVSQCFEEGADFYSPHEVGYTFEPVKKTERL